MPRGIPLKILKAASYETAFLGGAGYEIRTRDFHLGKVTLYH